MQQDKSKKFVCIILAAGEGRRLGMPKWQAVYNNKTFLEIIVNKARQTDVSRIICVIGKGSNPDIKGIDFAINPYSKRGMFSSLSIGIKSSINASGYFIIPVDHPFFETVTLKNLSKQFISGKCNCVVRPLYKGKAGHPIVIPHSLAEKIPSGDYDGGLNKFIKDSGFPVESMDTNDPGILKNINTKDDLTN